MKIIDAKYNAINGVNTSVTANINSTVMSVPTDPANTEYAEIEKQRLAGTLIIEDAD
jgi:hypothetical protein